MPSRNERKCPIGCPSYCCPCPSNSLSFHHCLQSYSSKKAFLQHTDLCSACREYLEQVAKGNHHQLCSGIPGVTQNAEWAAIIPSIHLARPLGLNKVSVFKRLRVLDLPTFSHCSKTFGRKFFSLLGSLEFFKTVLMANKNNALFGMMKYWFV